MTNSHSFLNIKNISNSDLISGIERLVRTERKITHLILAHIAEIEERKIFAVLGFDSMYSYLTRKLGYSEAAAYRRLHSARLLKQTPEITQKIEDGSLNLSQLTQVQKCIKESQKSGAQISADEKRQILQKLENKTSYETEKVLAVEFNKPIQTHELIRPQQDDSVRLQLTLTKEQFQQLEQAKSLLSHICPNGNWAEVIATLAKNYNNKKLKGRSKLDPTDSVISIAKVTDISECEAGRVKSSVGGAIGIKDKKSPQSTTLSFAATRVSKSREYISVYTKRTLLNKADYCCEYINPRTKQRCQSKYKLQIDHIHPWALGGSNRLENLRMLCQAHNNLRNIKLLAMG